VAQAPADDLAADFNVAPTKQVYIVAERPADDAPAGVDRRLAVARWGLVPSWAKDPVIGSKLINARAETAATKPAFRSAFAHRRCIVPADGYYEWYDPVAEDAPRGRSGRPLKQPFFIHPADGRSLAMAGLYEFWRDPAAQPTDPWLMTVAILTTTATDALGRIHDRMPLPIPPGLWHRWLDPAAGAAAAAEVLQSHTAGELVAYPVSTAVNNVRNNGPELIVPLPAAGQPTSR